MSNWSSPEYAGMDKAQALLAGQARVLEMIATNASLSDTLTSLVSLIESQFEGLLCSVLLLDEDGRHVRHGAAPSLPAAYTSAIDGQQIGPTAGSCGTAMYRREPVFVTDIVQDPLWRDYRDLATQHGLRACWSTPFFSHKGRVLGSFALYYREPRSPSPAEIQLISVGTRIASIAIEQWQAQEALQKAEQNYRAIFERANIGIFQSTVAGRFLNVNPAMARMFGFDSPEEFMASIADIGRQVYADPKDREKFQRQVEQQGFVRDFECQVRRKDGSLMWLLVNAHSVQENGVAVGYEGTCEDITQRKLLESALRQSEDRYRDLFEHSKDLVYTHSLQGHLLSVNPESARVLGHTVEELLQTPMRQLVAPEFRDGFDAYLAEIASTGAAQGLLVLQTRTGETRIWEYHNTLRTEGVPFPMVRGLARDVTERLQAEKTLRQSEERFAKAFRSSPLAITISTVAEGRYLDVNDAFLQMLGCTREQVLGRTSTEINFWEDPSDRTAMVQQLQETGRVNHLGFRYRTVRGEIREGVVAAEQVELNGLPCMLAITQDVTETKRAEEALRASEQRLRTLTEASFEGLVFSENGIVQDANEQFAQLMGYARKELIGVALRNFAAPEFRELVDEALRRGGMSRYEAMALRQDGSVFPAEVCGRMAEIGGRKIRVSAVRDVTARKQAETRIKEAEERLQGLADNLPSGMVFQALREPDGTMRFLYVSAGVERATGLKPAAILQDASLLYATIVAEDRALLDAERQRSLRDMTPINLELRFRAADGELRWAHVLSAPRSLPNGRVLWDGLAVNITTQKRAEEALRRSEEKFSKAFFSSPEGMAISTRDEGRIIEVNEAYTRMMGYSRSELIGNTVPELGMWVPGERDAVLAKLAEGEVVRNHETHLRAKGGRIVDAQFSTERIQVGNEECLLSTIRDITEHRRLEQQYRAAQKMEAVGRLAGGIAHDFNNILGIILGYAQMAQQRVPPDEPLRKALANISKAGERAAALTRQLMAFSRQQVLQPAVLDLNRVVAELWKILPRLLGEDVETELRLAPHLGSIHADLGQIEQVIMNLAVNARDAMPDGGKLFVETAEVELDSRAADRHKAEIPPGCYVMLAVTDTGIGMDAQTQSKIFEPFFTTKQVGEGTGLGLATVYGIVKQSGGYIWVYSEPGRGSTFKVFLPRVQAEASTELRPASARSAGGTETILLVENEVALREITVEYLRMRGYVVLEAGSQKEALQLCALHPGTIHLMVTDVVMPGGSGPETARLVLETRPGMGIIYVSGFTDQAVSRELDKQGAVFLQKPFAFDALGARIRSLLDANVQRMGAQAT